MQVETVSLDKVLLHPENPRRGDISKLAESLREHGQYKPLVVQRTTSYVLAGNHTLLAARQLGWADIAVTYLDVDATQARKILLIDNRSSDISFYDNDMLAELLTDLGDLQGTGYTPDDLDDLLATLEAMPVLPPQTTDADWGESPEQLQARMDRYADAQPRSALGMRDIVLIYPQAEFDEFQQLIRLLRHDGQPASYVVLQLLRQATP